MNQQPMLVTVPLGPLKELLAQKEQYEMRLLEEKLQRLRMQGSYEILQKKEDGKAAVNGMLCGLQDILAHDILRQLEGVHDILRQVEANGMHNSCSTEPRKEEKEKNPGVTEVAINLNYRDPVSRGSQDCPPTDTSSNFLQSIKDDKSPKLSSDDNSPNAGGFVILHTAPTGEIIPGGADSANNVIQQGDLVSSYPPWKGKDRIDRIKQITNVFDSETKHAREPKGK